ncbi:hypothetical protein B0H13DRAFT_2392487 [Mycena leptocephala]|nr:hypothetical protein B0H13DRAFT_2392487 [Mycena leptocephala]
MHHVARSSTGGAHRHARADSGVGEDIRALMFALRNIRLDSPALLWVSLGCSGCGLAATTRSAQETRAGRFERRLGLLARSGIHRDNARKSARADFEYTTHPTPRPRSAHALMADSADRVGTAIACTSVTQRSAPVQNDKHPALAAAWKICMRGLARTHIHPYHCPNLDSAYLRVWY